MTSLTTTTKPSSSTYERDVATEVTRVLRLFDRRKMPAAEFAEIVADYVAVLRGLRLNSIREAVMRFCRGQVDGASKSFAPTTAELFSEADRIQRLEDLREAYERRRSLPPPRPVPAEEPKRLISPEQMAQLRAVVGLPLQPMTTTRREEA
jgi:hypothetical protein